MRYLAILNCPATGQLVKGRHGAGSYGHVAGNRVSYALAQSHPAGGSVYRPEIELGFSKLKQYLRRAGARSREALERERNWRSPWDNYL